MEPKYRNIFELFSNNAEAREYFNQLPDFVCDRIIMQGGDLHTYQGLQDAVRGIMRRGNDRGIL
jgi:hypothetical protein